MPEPIQTALQAQRFPFIDSVRTAMHSSRRLISMRAAAAIVLFLALGGAPAPAQNPALAFVNGIGGNATESAAAVATDAAGNIYVTGRFEGTVDFDPGAATATLTCAGTAGTADADAFVASYDAAGAYRWAFRLGGHPDGVTSDNRGTAIEVTGTGDIVVSGLFYGPADFDPGVGSALISGAVGTSSVFVARYTSVGSYVWAFPLAGATWPALTIAPNDDVVLAGMFFGTTDFDPGPGTSSLSSVRVGGRNNDNSTYDVFIARYSPTGAYRWAFRLGNELQESADAVDMDASGNIYVTGSFNNGPTATTSSSVDFDPGKGKAALTGPGLYVARYSGTGAYAWAFKLAGSATLENNLAVDASGNVVVTGGFNGTVDFNPGAGTANLTGLGSNGNYDVFVARYTSSGAYQWAFTPAVGYASGVAINGSGDIHLTGLFKGTNDFDPGSGVATLAGNANGNGGYVAKYSANGAYLWAFALSATAGQGWGRAVATSSNGDIVVAGHYAGVVEFDPISASAQLSSTLSSTGTPTSDIFVAAYVEQLLPKRAGGSSGIREMLLH